MTPSTDDLSGQCNLCGWMSRSTPSRTDAQEAAVWHVYEEHPEEWQSLFGDRPPLAQRPWEGTL